VNVNSGELILPRVANYPKYLTSAGGEVIDLMAQLKRPLDPWQAWIIERGLGQVRDEEIPSELVMAADTCGCWVPRQNGKGDIIMALEMGWLFLFGATLIGHSAHLYATAAEGFQRIKVLIEENDAILGSAIEHVWSANGKQGIELTKAYKRARLLFAAREGGQGLGFSFPKLIMDEAQALTAELMQTLAPTQSAMWDPQVWFFGTPPRNDKAWIYKIKEAGEACDPTTAWFDYGIEYINPQTEADEFRRTVGSDETNRLTNPSMGVRRENRTGIRAKTIEGEIKKLGRSTMAFAMERNGMWLPKARVAGDNSIDPAVWARLAAATPAVPPEIAVAFYINPKRTHGTIMWAGKIGGMWRIGIAEHKPGVDWIIPKLADMKMKYGPIAFAVDARGESVIKELKEIGIEVPKDRDRPKRGDLFIPGIDGMAQAFGLLVDSATAQVPMILHHNEPPLNAAVSVPARPLGGGSTFDHKAGVEVGPACAGGLAMLAYRERVDKAVSEYDPLAFIH
jgi:hypothetical protein